MPWAAPEQDAARGSSETRRCSCVGCICVAHCSSVAPDDAVNAHMLVREQQSQFCRQRRRALMHGRWGEGRSEAWLSAEKCNGRRRGGSGGGGARADVWAAPCACIRFGECLQATGLVRRHAMHMCLFGWQAGIVTTPSMRWLETRTVSHTRVNGVVHSQRRSKQVVDWLIKSLSKRY